jgi:hypothetical protein
VTPWWVGTTVLKERAVFIFTLQIQKRRQYVPPKLLELAETEHDLTQKTAV